MTRSLLAACAVAAAGVALAADPPPRAAPAPVELVLLDGDKPVRLELRAEVDGAAVAAAWDAAFAKLFAFFDRDGDGKLNEKEAARLPSPRSLRQAMGSGFAPPVGAAPTFAELDRDKDGKVTPAELAAAYHAAGLGRVQIGVGRLPASAALSAALLKAIDTDGDGKVSEKEWKAAADTLRKLDANDDELIGAGELVPKTLYPGAAGTLLLTSPAGETPDALAKLPLVLLPEDPKDGGWATELARRNPALKAGDLPAWRNGKPDSLWTVKLSAKAATAERFAFAGTRHRIDGWVAVGRVDEAFNSARKQLVGQFEAGDPEEEAGGGGRRRPGGIGWLTPIADRDGDGKLDRKELDAWLELQDSLAKGQVLLTVLDGGGLFELLDANHDGALSVRELRGAWDRLKAARCVADGAPDPKRVPNVLLLAASRGYPQSLALDARRGPAWFRAMDKNGDGDVSRREFTGPAEAFDKFDLDKDGLIDADEATKADAQK